MIVQCKKMKLFADAVVYIDMTVVAEDGQKYIVNDYLKHIPTGEEWNIGDVVKIVYRGSIQETSPAVIEKESAIAVVDRAQDDQ